MTTRGQIAGGVDSINLAGSGGSNLVGFLQAGTGAVARTVQDKERDIVSVKDFGATGDGVTDDTAAIQAAITAINTAGGGDVIFPSGTYKITAALTVYSDTHLIGAGRGATIITCSNGELNHITINARTRSSVSKMTIQITGAGTTYVAGVIVIGGSSTYCDVDDVEIIGASWAGILVQSSSYCTIKNCSFSGGLGTVQDSSDICLYQNAQYNTVQNNFCYGGGYSGIFVQDPGGATLPYKNNIIGNHVGAHSAYGIIVYCVTAADLFCQIIGNFVEDIIGTAVSGNSGAGIYIQQSGGCVVANNNVRNCCTGTTSSTLSPAGIGSLNITAALQPTIISNNTITDMARYHGIYVVSSAGGAVVSGNTVRVSVSGGTQGNGIYVVNANKVSVSNNVINGPQTTTASGIYIFATNYAVDGITISGNVINGFNTCGIRGLVSGTGTFTNINIVGNSVYGGSANCIPLQYQVVTRMTVSGNTFDANTIYPIDHVDSTNVTLSGNTFRTSGSVGPKFRNTNVACYFDKTNIWNGTLSNTGTGTIVETLGSAAPTTGTWAVGDRVEQSVPVAGNPKGWRCTVAGTQGTWVSEGNL